MTLFGILWIIVGGGGGGICEPSVQIQAYLLYPTHVSEIFQSLLWSLNITQEYLVRATALDTHTNWLSLHYINLHAPVIVIILMGMSESNEKTL